MSTPNPPLLLEGTRIQYLGMAAVVIRDNDNRDLMWGDEPVSRFVTIKLDKVYDGNSTGIMEVYASACGLI